MVDPEILRQRLSYDSESGALTWKHRPNITKGDKVFNKRFAGRPALTWVCPDGYMRGCIHPFGVIRTHRAIWAMMHDEYPEFIDHKNGDRTDNRLANLRAVTKRENAQNQKRRTDNTSGATGVSWHAASGKWRARIQVGDKRTDVGLFATIAEAAAARRVAEGSHNYGPNHGR